jgi:hypothetical protein
VRRPVKPGLMMTKEALIIKTYRLRKFLVAKSGIIFGSNSKGEVWYEIRYKGKLIHWAYIVQEDPYEVVLRKFNQQKANYKLNNHSV